MATRFDTLGEVPDASTSADGPKPDVWDRLDRWTSRRFGRLIARLERWPAWKLDVVSLLAFGGSVLFDAGLHAAGAGAVSVSPLYTLSIAFTGFFCRLWLVFATSAAGAAIWTFLDVQSRDASNGLPAAWNGLARFTLFAVVGLLMNLLRKRLDEEERLASTDSLTGVANARAFYSRSRTELARARREGTPITFAYVDVDDFKSINDTFGHPVGDEVLAQLAHALGDSVRETDLVGRLGGDEFAIVFPSTGVDAARAALDRVRAQTAGLHLDTVPIRFTLGAVSFSEPPATPELAIREVDQLLYEGKADGRNVTRLAEGPIPLPEACRLTDAPRRSRAL